MQRSFMKTFFVYKHYNIIHKAPYFCGNFSPLYLKHSQDLIRQQASWKFEDFVSRNAELRISTHSREDY